MNKLIQWLLESNSISIPTLYHISFNGNLEKIWYPQNPAGSNFSSKNNATTEPDLPRISTSDSLEKCFQAIYPNVYRYFEEENYPYMEFYVYSPILNGNEKILVPEELTRLKYVHDAHMTNEYCILTPVFMKKVMKIRIKNTNKNKFLKYKEFGTGKERSFAPDNIIVKVIEKY